jgi:hypothetical protein
MNLKSWTPSDEVKKLVVLTPFQKIRDRSISELYYASDFYLANPKMIADRLAITFSKKWIIFTEKIITQTVGFQAALIVHELTHVAQQSHYGWTGFMGTYLGQWMRSGFSYVKMLDKGLEKEAYDNERKFVNVLVAQGYPCAYSKLA